MIKLLCLGDAHLGRAPSRVPSNDSSLSVRAVWKQVIADAIEMKVDAVILTGDMADNRNSYFEAFGVLRSGLSELSKHKIPVVAIAGNHDYEVFPQLVDSMSDDNLIFLGREGIWSKHTLTCLSGQSLRCVGWSFPSSHYDKSPLDTLDLQPSDHFTIGIAHGDLVSTSKYAPLPKQGLDAKPVDLWLLGHIHAPKLHEDYRAPVLYPGSLQPLDPAEPGVHGPWLITIDDRNRIQADQLPCATVRYEQIPIDVSGMDQIDDINMAVTTQLDQFARKLIQQQSQLRYLSCRLDVRGQTRLHRKLVTEGLGNIDTFDGQFNDCRVGIDKVSINTELSRDLHEIAQLNNDPPGMLAQWLLELGSSDNHALLKCSEDVAAAVYRSAGFKDLGENQPDSETLSRLVKEQSLLLLDELLSQKEDHD